MKLIDFSNHQNRHIRKEDVGEAYVSKLKEMVAQDTMYYPSYHIAPPHGLLNDPNGLYQDEQGEYHIFYQWFPLGTVHGLKHWHHLTTKDFIDYKSFGNAITPDTDFDGYGCYSGMALREATRTHIYYTGIRREGGQLLPSIVYATFENGEVRKAGIIEDVDFKRTTENYRDPFVFKRGDDYYMIVGGESPENRGILLVNKGSSPTEFKPMGNLKIMDYPYGYMLECPNYFENDQYGVLIFSPQGIEKRGRYDFQNVFSVVYAVGKPIDFDTQTFEHESFYEMDKGFDFYAPQVFTDNQGRQVLLGWLGNSKCEYPSDKFQWAHMLTLPREVTIEGDRIKQWPIAEVHALRQEEQVLTDVRNLTSKAFELSFEATDGFEIILQNEANERLIFSGNTEEFCLNRGATSHLYNEQYGQQRFAPRLTKENHMIRMFVDYSSVEIFADNGLTVFTSRFYLDGDWKLLSLGTSFNYYRLGSIYIENKKRY
ncbi:sucrose-6-phosphate hydrolase [Bacillaceae bacterium Marseille-Q3522]|nr:sucrose-6-phosphate hydrolase [Bacillaceae bacterium Marseille-Q3522]